MIKYSTFLGRAFILNCEYPVYNDECDLIGYTDKEDIAVVTFDNKNDEDLYLELTLVTGEFSGYDGLALNLDDIKKATLLSWLSRNSDSLVYVRDTKFFCL